jgi:hypothetical protein
VARGYWLRRVASASNATIGEQVLQRWRKKGCVTSSTEGISTMRTADHRPGQALRLPDLAAIKRQRGTVARGQLGVHLANGTPPPNS